MTDARPLTHLLLGGLLCEGSQALELGGCVNSAGLSSLVEGTLLLGEGGLVLVQRELLQPCKEGSRSAG